MAFRVQISPRPIVIDADGLPVPKSHVVEITFPTDATDTMIGKMPTLVGAGAAKILVGDLIVRGVPLC